MTTRIQPPINKAVAQRSILRMMLADIRKTPALGTAFPCLVTLFGSSPKIRSDRERWDAIIAGLEELV